MFEHDFNDDGTVNIRAVPIFRTHRDRKYNCDETWLDRCVADFLCQKHESIEMAGGDARYAMLPSLTEGHTPEDPNAPEPPCEGHLDNLCRKGKLLYADLVRVSRETWGKIKAGKLPCRSAEVIPSKHRITNLSLLGGRYPHFGLPAMRYMSRTYGCEVLRYTFTPETTAMPFSPEELLQLANTLAPMVADIMSGKQSEAVTADVQGGGIADDAQGSDAGNDLAEPNDQPMPFRATAPTQRHVNGQFKANGQQRRDATERHGDATVSASGKRGNAFATNEFKPRTEGNEASMGTTEQGQGNPAKTEDNNVKSYAALSRENTQLREIVRNLEGKVGEIQRHQASEAQATKRVMIRSKCREVAALGYAIGDSDHIERHVDRMMGMDAEGVKSYIDDVLRKAPKVQTAPTSRYSAHDVIRRPGAETDENERYYAENKEDCDRFGLSPEILALADVLSDGN